MLDLMRKHARNWLMKVVLGIIVIVFVFYFGAMGHMKRTERIAVIDGKPIVEADFQREYQKALEMYRQQFGRELTEEVLRSLNVKQQVFNQMIDQAVIVAMAKEMGVRVTDAELQATILSYPGFQRNGAFDQQTYEMVLRQIRMTPEEFEEGQRKAMIAMRIEDLIRDGVRVSEQELLDLYRMRTEEINCDFLRIAPNRFQAALKVTPENLEAFLRTREAQFRIPEQVQLKFLAFRGADYADRVKVSDAEVADYYDRHRSRFTKDNQVQPLDTVRGAIIRELSQINGLYAAGDAAKRAHDTIYQTEDFDGYARENGLPVRTTEFFPLSAPPEEFRGIADFARHISVLQANDTSRVIQGELGYYLFTIADRRAARLPAMKEIETALTKLYRETETNRLAREEAESLLARLRRGETLEALAKEKGLAIGSTGLFQPGMPIPKLGASPELTEALFELSAKNPYPQQPALIDGHYVIVRFKERSRVDEAAFASQKEAIAQALEQQKKEMAVRAWVEGSTAALIKEGRLEIIRDIKDL